MRKQAKTCFLTATEILKGYKSKSFSPVQVMKDTIEQIHSNNPKLNAYCFIEDDRILLQQAKESEERWLRGDVRALEGVPISIKDLLEVKGWKTKYGSKSYPDKIDDEDAPVVARLREQGAIIIGKTTTPEFGWKGVTDSKLCGVTCNPHNPTKTAGGSSGGSGAAVAAYMGPISIGTDGAGSVRIPSSFCGISTIKPTYALIAHLVSKFGTLSTIGPMTRTIQDAALVMNVIAKPDPRDWYSIRSKSHFHFDFLKNLEEHDDSLNGIRIAYSTTLGGYVNKIHPEVKEACDKAVKILEKLGAIVEYVDPPLNEYPLYETFKTTWFAGCANVFHQLKLDPNDPNLEEGFIRCTKKGKKLTAVDYLNAENNRAKMGVAMNFFHKKYDLLVTPTLPIPAFSIGTLIPEEEELKEYTFPENHEADGEWWTWSPFCYPFNLTKQPASSIPCGKTKNGLPIGIQIVGSLYDDALVLKASHHLQKFVDYEI